MLLIRNSTSYQIRSLRIPTQKVSVIDFLSIQCQIIIVRSDVVLLFWCCTLTRIMAFRWPACLSCYGCYFVIRQHILYCLISIEDRSSLFSLNMLLLYPTCPAMCLRRATGQHKTDEYCVVKMRSNTRRLLSQQSPSIRFLIGHFTWHSIVPYCPLLIPITYSQCVGNGCLWRHTIQPLISTKPASPG